MIKDIFETKPDFINEAGTSFWLDKSSTDYAKKKGLKNTKVFYLKDKKGYKTRVVIKNKEYAFENQRYVFESQTLNGILFHLDILAIVEKIIKK